MFFLIRAAFWLCVVILLIPADPKSGAEAPRVTLVQAFLAAQATVSDISGFCGRNPDVCATGGAAIDLLAEKAESGVRMLNRYFDQKDRNSAAPAAAAPTADRDTLNDDDLEPAWRAPRRDGSA
ncbi:MAG TPA: DUF5330 domain-containing protein [Bauldia sp.]|nr:DUF5330 domain-containing protein [Bauldia sp.]